MSKTASAYIFLAAVNRISSKSFDSSSKISYANGRIEKIHLKKRKKTINFILKLDYYFYLFRRGVLNGAKYFIAAFSIICVRHLCSHIGESEILKLLLRCEYINTVNKGLVKIKKNSFSIWILRWQNDTLQI